MDGESVRLHLTAQTISHQLCESVDDINDLTGDQVIVGHIQSNVRPRLKKLIDALQEYEAYLRRP